MKETTEIAVINQQAKELEKSQQSALTQIYEGMQNLIDKGNEIENVMVGDKVAYGFANNLKKEIKTTHVALEKKRKQLKAPLLEMGRNLDGFAKALIDPLKQAESVIKDKCALYLEEETRVKEEKRLQAEEELQKKENEQKTINALSEWCNSKMKGIEQVNNFGDLKNLETEIASKFNDLNINDFGDNQSQVTFMQSQLTSLINMKKSALPKQGKKTSPEIEYLEFRNLTPESKDLFDNEEEPEEKAPFLEEIDEKTNLENNQARVENEEEKELGFYDLFCDLLILTTHLLDLISEIGDAELNDVREISESEELKELKTFIRGVILAHNIARTLKNREGGKASKEQSRQT